MRPEIILVISNKFTGIGIRSTNHRRDMNNSVQYVAPGEDMTQHPKSNMLNANVFSISDRDTANTTEETNKYYNTSINFNQFNQSKKRKVLESFNLVSVDRKKDSRRHVMRTINPSFRQSPRFVNASIPDQTLPNRLPINSKNKHNEFIFNKLGKFKRPNNFKNFKKLKITHRRTTTNSPNYNDVTLASVFNDMQPKSNGLFVKPASNLNMTMYGQVMNIPQKHIHTPSTSMQAQR